MKCRLRHSAFGTIKDSGLVHIEPNMEEIVSTIEEIEAIHRTPEVSAVLVHKINVNAQPRPAHAHEVFESFVVLHKDALTCYPYPFIGCMEYLALFIDSDVGICDSN